MDNIFSNPTSRILIHYWAWSRQEINEFINEVDVALRQNSFQMEPFIIIFMYIKIDQTGSDVFSFGVVLIMEEEDGEILKCGILLDETILEKSLFISTIITIGLVV
ncbi:hypothetical protein ACJX0J_008301, partial [Zea mays]